VEEAVIARELNEGRGRAGFSTGNVDGGGPGGVGAEGEETRVAIGDEGDVVDVLGGGPRRGGEATAPIGGGPGGGGGDEIVTGFDETELDGTSVPAGAVPDI
jgi:hypothetical protein